MPKKSAVKAVLTDFPYFLIVLFLLAEDEMGKSAVNVSYQTLISALSCVIFFAIALILNLDKGIAFLAAFLFWLVMLQIKHGSVL